MYISWLYKKLFWFKTNFHELLSTIQYLLILALPLPLINLNQQCLMKYYLNKYKRLFVSIAVTDITRFKKSTLVFYLPQSTLYLNEIKTLSVL